MEITEKLSKNSNIWSGYVSDFNESDTKGKISIKAMTNIIKPLLAFWNAFRDDPKNNNPTLDAKDMALKTFDAYWNGLALWEPKLFDANTREKFNIMNASITEVMTGVLINILRETEPWKTLGTSIGDLKNPKTYTSLVSKAFNGLTLSNKEGHNVHGSNCWRVGKAGHMGLVTNQGAKRDMTSLLFKEIKTQLKIKNPSII